MGEAAPWHTVLLATACCMLLVAIGVALFRACFVFVCQASSCSAATICHIYLCQELERVHMHYRMLPLVRFYDFLKDTSYVDRECKLKIRNMQVSDLKPDVLTHIQHILDPRKTLFEGSIMDSVSKVSGTKGKLVRHLDRERGVAGLLPLTLILDVKHQQFWQPSDTQYVLHCERYCYFPRSSTVRSFLN